MLPPAPLNIEAKTLITPTSAKASPVPPAVPLAAEDDVLFPDVSESNIGFRIALPFEPALVKTDVIVSAAEFAT